MVEHRGSCWDRCSRKKKESQDIMVNANAQTGNREEDQQNCDEQTVDRQVTRKEAGFSNVVNLDDHNAQKGRDDNYECRHCSWLCLDIGWSQTLNWDQWCKGVVVQDADEVRAEEENCLLNLESARRKSIE